ncbi:hypothetical protein [Alishewanella tabrizica]|uniref:Uncharacterized protein n=1 Tax=Alishewanella tabrizica TaxID=671278 RepID=A0ABQ2WJT6_9ALTE|nr:hypothetical protein [Alishewanella tabrizica]GGW59112.1 hypothetical protein GCM10008111_14000 [Alishewanella tabrizica]
MKKRLGGLAVLIIVVLLILWRLTSNTPPIPTGNALPQVAPTSQAAQPEVSGAAAPAQLNITENIEAPMAEQFAQIAQAYAEELRYPPYSRPLSAADHHLLTPNEYAVQTIPLEGGASAAIVLTQYRFIYPDEIPTALLLTGIQASEVVLSLFAENTGELLTEIPMEADTEGYQVTVAANTTWQGPLKLAIRFTANGQQQQLHTGIEYQQPTAKIVGVNDGFAEGSDLVIPVQLDVSKAGHYRLRANLFSEQGEPIAHLVATTYLNTGNATLPLRAFKAVLAGHEGPYRLNTFVLERRSGSPGELSLFGSSEQAEYPVEFYGLNQLSDAPWQPDEQELLRLQFLNELAPTKP